MNLKLENKNNSVLRIEVGIWIPKIQSFAKSIVIFDTGAYKTIVDEELAALLELPVAIKKRVSIVTATGVFATRSSVLPRMLLGKATIQNIPVNVMKLPEELETRCILGMNVLQEYEINISSFDKTVKLIHRPLPNEYFRADYSINLTADEDDGVSI